MATTYSDRWITLDDRELTIRGYYLPWGAKRIPYDRIWGTANPRVWASFDPLRPTKRTGFLIDNGGSITPLITPDDPEAAEAALRAHLRSGVLSEGSRRAPIV
jgi:hypothetical protein